MRDLNTAAVVNLRCIMEYQCVFFRRSSQHHSKNDSSSSTSWSDDSHVFSHSRTLVVPGTFLRVLYNNIHHHVSFARELVEKEKKTRAGPTSSTFHFSFSCGMAYSRGTRTPESEKSRRRHMSSNGKWQIKKMVHVLGTYISPFVELQFTRNPALRIASLRLAETLRPTALPHGNALHL